MWKDMASCRAFEHLLPRLERQHDLPFWWDRWHAGINRFERHHRLKGLRWIVWRGDGSPRRVSGGWDYLRELADRGVRTVPTEWVEAGTTVDVARVLRERAWTGGFLKPAIGATSRETLRFDTTPTALTRAQAHLERLAARETMLLQPYLSSVEAGGEISAVFIDDQLSHSLRKLPPPGDYRVQDDFGATDEPFELDTTEQEQAAQAVHAAAAASGLREPLLYARADFLRNDRGQLCLIELEAVEPSLFCRHDPTAADRLAAALTRRLSR